MNIFFSDLDNTLIYSHRKRPLSPSIVVEKIGDKNQSFMTKKTFDYLLNHKNFQLIPVTSRTQSQYLRLHPVLQTLNCTESLICNGGKLLVNGVSDDKWLEDTYKTIKNERDETKRAGQILRQLSDSHKLITDEDLFYYSIDSHVLETVTKLKQLVDTSKVNIQFDERKVYCFPVSLNKGQALRRYLFSHSHGLCIAAGDNQNDLSMLDYSDYLIISQYVSNYHCDNIIPYSGEGVFSDYICTVLNKMFKNTCS